MFVVAVPAVLFIVKVPVGSGVGVAVGVFVGVGVTVDGVTVNVLVISTTLADVGYVGITALTVYVPDPLAGLDLGIAMTCLPTLGFNVTSHVVVESTIHSTSDSLI